MGVRNRRIGCLVVGLVLIALIITGAVVVARLSRDGPVLPGAQRCVATTGDSSVAVDLDQAHNVAIIAGVAVDRKLAPRAVSIALATAYQESGIHNLDYGDRDSIGLFQQRPSQGWGSADQIMDPYYATGKFYDALVKIDNWQTGDITDVAQKVQRSGVPNAYRDHEPDARILARVFTGQSAAGLSCLERSSNVGDAAALSASVKKTFGISRTAVSGNLVVIAAGSASRAWVVAAHVIANSGPFGVADVTVGSQQWTRDATTVPAWTKASAPAGTGQVVITLR